MGILYEGASPTAFIAVTLVLGGGAAWMMGRGIASKWSNPLLLIGYSALLAGAVRFLHFALADGTLFSGWYWLVDFIILTAFAALSFQVRRATQMTTQYFWLYRRTSPLTWAEKDSSAS